MFHNVNLQFYQFGKKVKTHYDICNTTCNTPVTCIVSKSGFAIMKAGYDNVMYSVRTGDIS